MVLVPLPVQSQMQIKRAQLLGQMNELEQHQPGKLDGDMWNEIP
jgi:hypothetical protein